MKTETDRTRKRWDRMAPGYDRSISWFERALFGGGREWVCSQAVGDTLEIAIGTGRNLSFYPAGLELTGIELSPQMLKLARARAGEIGRPVQIQEGMRSCSRSRTTRSTPSSAPLLPARFQMMGPPSGRRFESSGRMVVSFCSNT